LCVALHTAVIQTRVTFTNAVLLVIDKPVELAIFGHLSYFLQLLNNVSFVYHHVSGFFKDAVFEICRLTFGQPISAITTQRGMTTNNCLRHNEDANKQLFKTSRTNTLSRRLKNYRTWRLFKTTATRSREGAGYLVGCQ